MRLYAQHADQRDSFEILAFHDASVKSLKELRQKLKPIEKSVWRGKSLPFPILLDATDQTHGTNWGINGYPTVVLVDPEGRLLGEESHHTLQAILQAERAGGSPLALSVDGRQAAIAQADRIKLSRSASDTVSFPSGHGHGFTALAFSPTGQLLASGGRDRSIKLWDVDSQTPRFKLQGHRGAILGLAFSPDGRFLASGGFEATRLWNLESGRPHPHLPTNQFGAWSVAFSPDGATLAAGGFKAVRTWDIANGAEKLNLKTKWIARALAFSTDGATLAVADEQEVSIWNAATGQAQGHLQGPASDILWLVFAEDNRSVAAVTRAGTTRHWDLPAGTESTVPPGALSKLATRVGLELPENPAALLDECWAVLLQPGASASAYALALTQAERALRPAPQDPRSLRAVGAGLYRTGNYKRAVEILTRCDTLEPKPTGSDLLIQRTFLALAHKKNLDENRARAALARFWSVPTDPDRPGAQGQEVFREFFGTNGLEARAVATRLAARHPDYAVAQRAAADLPDPALRRATLEILPYASAQQIVQSAEREFLLKTQVVARAEKSVTNGPAILRELVREFAGQFTESPSALNSAAWSVVSRADLPAAHYQLALLQAETAYRLSPEPTILNTLGVAQYRAGQFNDAVTTLRGSRRVNSSGADSPEDLAFIAMAQFRLGDVSGARKSLKRLRAATKDVQMSAEGAGFLREAEQLIDPAPAPGSDAQAKQPG